MNKGQLKNFLTQRTKAVPSRMTAGRAAIETGMFHAAHNELT